MLILGGIHGDTVTLRGGEWGIRGVFIPSTAPQRSGQYSSISELFIQHAACSSIMLGNSS